MCAGWACTCVRVGSVSDRDWTRLSAAQSREADRGGKKSARGGLMMQEGGRDGRICALKKGGKNAEKRQQEPLLSVFT